MLLHETIPFFDAEFADYLKLGWDHIIDVKAYDHLLFVMTLCALFTVHEWRRILVIVTAFTIGHSLTLALSALNYMVMPQEWVEMLIPMTILATAITNALGTKSTAELKTFDRRTALKYGIALCFGLIHGLGFANNFRFMLGEESSIAKQLFAFNTGLELGQITVVAAFMAVLYVLTRFFRIVHREWTLFISGAGAGIAIILLINVLTQ